MLFDDPVLTFLRRAERQLLGPVATFEAAEEVDPAS